MNSRILVAALAAVTVGGLTSAQAATSPNPVYVHMNGTNVFLENVVAVRPGQDVVFVNEDTGAHTIIGFEPTTGKVNTRFDGAVAGTKGPGHPVHTYSISFPQPGIVNYYCSVHAVLAKGPSGLTAAEIRPGMDSYGTSMSGIVVVTTDPKLLAGNPKTASEKVLPGYFGG
ncbi:MAG: Cupredoxin [Castellaniella sp.]|uniref:cupredoxin domain-containing protein n=1 Tax=Castellaniella sp. TaxID=1955812 RepID=UPI0011F8DAF6|nr:Cupredoxin [Castellaniella sp.]TAN25112.1 MAG: Cupredoxin [Castellaniella sp.]